MWVIYLRRSFDWRKDDHGLECDRDIPAALAERAWTMPLMREFGRDDASRDVESDPAKRRASIIGKNFCRPVDSCVEEGSRKRSRWRPFGWKREQFAFLGNGR